LNEARHSSKIRTEKDKLNRIERKQLIFFC
jgi:hypothetical protein